MVPSRLLLVAGALALTGAARAALVVPATVEELARGSDAVIRGRVGSVKARWTADGRRIFTYADVDASSVWRGSAPARLTVVLPGGVVGDIGQRVWGAPTLQEREEVILFLSTRGGQHYQVHGFAQGKYAVVAGEARPDLAFVEFATRAALRVGERRAEAMSLSELEKRVRNAR